MDGLPMPFGFGMMTVRTPPLERPNRPTKRDLATIITVARDVQTMREHAQRHACLPDAIASAVLDQWVQEVLPKRYQRDDAWMQRHVHLPVVYQMERLVPKWEAGEH